ncbi:MAG: TonB-dependent receptor, partial [Muribaculaceae bacterium]|nr:TonB-dependent receptor [Muribaculaceae bacterium]
LRSCDIDQHELYASLMFERKWADIHALSTGLQTNYDHYRYHTLLNPALSGTPAVYGENEAVAGAYAQYTFSPGEQLVAMAGLRYDWSNRFGGMFTPRLHLRYNALDNLSFHASAGKGYRSPHPLAEYSYLLASSRRMSVAPDLHRESAWNFGAGGSWSLYPAGKKTTLSAEYYYTTFSSQLMANLDIDPHAVYIYSYAGRSYSHSLQVELSVDLLSELNLTAAWRLTDVKADYLDNGTLQQKPLTPRHKGLVTLGWAPKMGLWQFDLSCAINGSGRMPRPYELTDGSLSWPETYPAFAGINAQITRNFRHWSVYLGGENLTGYRQRDPIVGASDPWGPDFDATMVYGPLEGAMIYVGFRYNITKYL